MNFLVKSVRVGISNVSGQSTNNMKRFYKQSTFSESDSKAHPMHKYLIHLDGKSMKTPYRNTLAVPSKALALMVTNEFNMQLKNMKTAEMPMLALSRTAVDADLEGHLAEHLKNTIFQYLKTDTLLFFEEKFDNRHQELVEPLVQNFKTRFNMEIEPSMTLQPPVVNISREFKEFVDSLNNWQLIGLETLTIWMKSTISAFSIIESEFDPIKVQQAAYLEETVQMEQFGEVEERTMDINQIRLMVSCGQLIYRLSKE